MLVCLMQILAPPLVDVHEPGREDQCHHRQREKEKGLGVSGLSVNVWVRLLRLKMDLRTSIDHAPIS